MSYVVKKNKNKSRYDVLKKPTCPEDKKLSKEHLKESIKFNKDHADDHLKAMKDAQKALKERE